MPAEEQIQYVPEPPGVPNRVVVASAVSALILLGGAIAGFYFVYQGYVPIKTVPAPQEFPQPRVVTAEQEIAERQKLTAEQTKRLHAWGWADDQHTLVQIPIDRAMTLLAGKGKDAYAPLLPAQPALSSPTAGAQNAITPNASSVSPPRGKQP